MLDGTIKLIGGKSLDFETVNLYHLTVKASDGALSTTSTLTVSICNVNEPPTITNLPKTVSVTRDAVGKILLATVSIEDEDAGDNHFYTISSTNPVNQLRNFTVDASLF